MAEITARGVRFHVQRLVPQHRPHQLEHPVVFVHGLMLDNLSSYYCTLANPVAHAGTEVVLYDLRGHGLSERPRTGYRLSDSVADLIAILDALGLDGPVHLVGNSYGGTIALAFAVGHPDRVVSTVLIEAHVPLPGWAEQVSIGVENLGPDVAEGEWGRWLTRRGKPNRLTELKDLVNHTTFVKDLLATVPISEGQLRMFSGPVRAVYGQDSGILHHAHILDSLLPRCELTVLPDRDHFLLTTATPTLRAIMLEWFAAKTMAPQVDLR